MSKFQFKCVPVAREYNCIRYTEKTRKDIIEMYPDRVRHIGVDEYGCEYERLNMSILCHEGLNPWQTLFYGDYLIEKGNELVIVSENDFKDGYVAL